MENKNHLPMYGVGPLYVAGIILITVIAVVLGHSPLFEDGIIEGLKVLWMVMGIILILLGACLWYGAVFGAKVDEGIVKNRLITSGVYAMSAILFIQRFCFSVQEHC